MTAFTMERLQTAIASIRAIAPPPARVIESLSALEPSHMTIAFPPHNPHRPAKLARKLLKRARRLSRLVQRPTILRFNDTYFVHPSRARELRARLGRP